MIVQPKLLKRARKITDADRARIIAAAINGGRRIRITKGHLKYIRSTAQLNRKEE
jgi:hypothetical protein